MKNGTPTQGERRYRWAVRYTGLGAFILSAALVTLQIPVPVWLPLTAAGCMGLDSIQGFEIKRRQRDGDK